MTAPKAQAAKKRIITLFRENVRGKKADTTLSNIRHDGKSGHWLEKQMGISHNASNSPDIDGFEMKNFTRSKTTFGDWSASYYLYRDEKYGITRDQFITIFGAPNILKKNRYSWSGKPCPKINEFNTFGQKLVVDDSNNIFAIYSFSKDLREDKSLVVPKLIQKDNLIIATWDAEMMKRRVEDKFNKLGWFKCLTDSDGVYTTIVFGDPITFESWIEGVKKGLIYFDSGMYVGNIRPYSQWRADNRYWESLVTDTYN